MSVTLCIISNYICSRALPGSPFTLKFLACGLVAFHVAPITNACWVCSDLQGQERLQVEHMLGIGEEFNPSGVETQKRGGRTVERKVMGMMKD